MAGRAAEVAGAPGAWSVPRHPGKVARLMRVECGWCGEVLEPGEGDAPTSHGVCEACARSFLRGEPGRVAASSSRRLIVQEPGE